MRYNPYTSKAQHRLFRALEARGELPRGTASRWYHETPHYESLPDYAPTRRRRHGRFSGFGQMPASCAWMTPGTLTRDQATGDIYVAGSQGECIATGWNYATVQSGQCGNFQGVNVCVTNKAQIGLMPTQADISEGPQQPGAPGASWWQTHGSEIVVGTITAVTGALAVYFAMRWFGKR